MTAARCLDVDTPSGPARLHVDGEGPARLVLGHGAGGRGATAATGTTGTTGTTGGRTTTAPAGPDLLAARAAALALGLQVVRVEQPWRVAGRPVAEPAPRLDAAWLAALAALPPLPVVVGGRSTGGRVACRTADRVPEVRGVLCLAFPLQPAGGRPDRAAELALPVVPRLVVQGGRDAFGVPAPSEGVEVHVVTGADHAFRVRRADGRTAADLRAEVDRVVRGWLQRVLVPYVGGNRS